MCIGSGVRAGKWLAHGFVKKHKEQLKKIPVAYFMLCMTLEKDTPKAQAKAAKYLKPTREIVPPVSEVHFAGKMDYSKLDWFSHFLLKYILVTPEGDFRNWELIKQWPQELYIKLLHR